MDVYHLVFIHCLKNLKEYIRQISLTYSLETKFILWYEETVFVREPYNGLLWVIFSPGPGFNAPCPYLRMMMMMMYLAWGLNRERRWPGPGWLWTGTELLRLRCRRTQGSGGRGGWPGTLTLYSVSSHHQQPGTFIICHQHRGSGGGHRHKNNESGAPFYSSW